MPDLTGFPALDVAIGLGFLFFLLSTVCSAINEMIANVLGWRAKTLEDAIRNVLGDDGARGEPKQGAVGSRVPLDLTSEVLGHWGVTSLVRDSTSKWRRRNRPSYLPSRVFSLAVVETLAGAPPAADADQEQGTPWKLTDEQLLEHAGAAIADLPRGARPALHKALVAAGGDLEVFRRHLERDFDESMKRASGWYKRKVQVALAVIATLLVVGLDVDAVRVANRLWREPALRSAVAARASAASTTAASAAPAATTGAATGGTGPAAVSPAESAARDVTAVKQLDLPIGWGSGNEPRDVGGVLGRVPGWLLTIAALMLGAPFWFDVLSKVARLRGSGEPQAPVARTDASPAPAPAPAPAAPAQAPPDAN